MVGATLIWLFFMIKYMLEDGVIENVLIVGDNTQTSVFNMPYKLTKAVMGFLTQVIRGRVRTVFGLNAPSTISVIWNVVRYFLDENS